MFLTNACRGGNANAMAKRTYPTVPWCSLSGPLKTAKNPGQKKVKHWPMCWTMRCAYHGSVQSRAKAYYG